MTNVCIVGYGAIGPIHAESVSLLPNVCVYAICDIDQTRAVAGAKQYSCKVFSNIEECLKDDNIDSIHICTPHYLHFEMIEKCIAAGKQVVVEKPIVMTQDELECLYTKYLGKPVFPIMQNRTNTCIQKLKEIMEKEPELGRFQAVKGLLTWCKDIHYYQRDFWRGTKTYEGGGVLINQSIHTLDLMLYLGGAVRSVYANTSNKSLQGVIEVEDTVDARLNFENGAVGIFYATNGYVKNSPIQIEWEFEHASFRYMDSKLYRDGLLICQDEGNFLGKDYWGFGHERQLYDIYVKKNPITLGDVKHTMQTMFAMYKSATIDDIVEIGK